MEPKQDWNPAVQTQPLSLVSALWGLGCHHHSGLGWLHVSPFVVGSPQRLSPWFGSTALSPTFLGNFPMYLATLSPWSFHWDWGFTFTFMPSPLMSSIKAIQFWHGLSSLGCLLEPCHEPPLILVSCMTASQQHVDNTRSCCQLEIKPGSPGSQLQWHPCAHPWLP